MKNEIKQKFIELLDEIDNVQKLEYKPGMVFIFKVQGVREQNKLARFHDQIEAGLELVFGQKVHFLLLNDTEIEIVESEAILDQSIADQIHE